MGIEDVAGGWYIEKNFCWGLRGLYFQEHKKWDINYKNLF